MTREGIEIYRRYNSNKMQSVTENKSTANNSYSTHASGGTRPLSSAPKSSAPHQQSTKQQIFRETAPPKSTTIPQCDAKPKPISNQARKQSDKKAILTYPPHTKSSQNHSEKKSKPYSFSLKNLLGSFFPPTFYNNKTKKVFGFLTTEDLLLIALILLFSENEENDDSFVVIALIYILLSDYIDLPDFLI